MSNLINVYQQRPAAAHAESPLFHAGLEQLAGKGSASAGVTVREKKLLGLEDAVRKMTSLNAARIGVTDRGTLKPGNFADVFKHAVLALVIERLKLKDAAFRVIDTHAGIGVYDLGSEAAQKTDTEGQAAKPYVLLRDAYLSRRRDASMIWPGFVDAVTTLLMVMMFVLTIFTVMQVVLRDTITTQSPGPSKDALITCMWPSL